MQVNKLCKLLSVALAVVCCTLIVGCRTSREASNVYVHTVDTLSRAESQRDSIFVYDSILIDIRERECTVFVTNERWHTRYRDLWHHDSIYVNRTDTVYLDREKVVEKKLTWWEEVKMYFGGIGICLVLTILVLCIFRKK